MGQLSVVCQKQKPLCVLVKASHREEIVSCRILQQLQYGPLFGILCRRYDTGRFVEHIINIRLIPVRNAKAPDPGGFFLYFDLRLFDDLSIHADLSFADQLFDFLPAACSHLC